MIEATKRVRMRWLSLSATAIAVLATASSAGGVSLGPVAKIREGGTFRVSFAGIDSVDPALAYTLGSWALLDTSCARLMNYADRPGRAGLRLVPEVAARYPRLSRDGTTYSFTLRRGFRFSNRPAPAGSMVWNAERWWRSSGR